VAQMLGVTERGHEVSCHLLCPTSCLVWGVDEPGWRGGKGGLGSCVLVCLHKGHG
jgi:hypothetical protein